MDVMKSDIQPIVPKTNYIALGNSKLSVSRICMGCMGFGDAKNGQHIWTLDESHSREIIKRGLEMGVNFFDTAIAYQSGTSEQYLGRALRDFARRHYPQAEEQYHWATQDCMSLDGVPYIGPYSASTKDLYVATGFNKWGMTSSMVSAMILTDLVQGKKNLYEEVFSPSRSILHPQLAVNGFEAMVSLLTPTTKRCPHLGCALKWNPVEHTWDCPCHGSRFTEEGELIDNPATGNLKK